MIHKIAVGTNASTLLGGINENRYVKIFSGEQEITGEGLVGTGMVVKLMDGDTVKSSVTVVVTGDTNGDGKINITDMLAIRAHILQKGELSSAAAQAADTNGDGKINITDMLAIRAHILGKSAVTPN